MYILLSTIASGEQIIFVRVIFKRKIFIIVFLSFPKICVATFSLVGSFRRYINSIYSIRVETNTNLKSSNSLDAKPSE